MQCENFILPLNSTINKTFYTCSTESLSLRYKKISKKAVKWGSFLQSSVHIFLEHDGCFRKINLRILWNHIMKNFQIKHGQCDSIIFRQKFFFWRLSVIARPFSFLQQDSLLFIFPGIYPQIYHMENPFWSFRHGNIENWHQKVRQLLQNETKNSYKVRHEFIWKRCQVSQSVTEVY